MPMYEYRCLACRRRFEVFLSYKDYGNVAVACTHCGSSNVQRRITRVRIALSDDARMERMADPAMLEGLEDDPKAMGAMMRRMGEEMGEDLGPEFHEVIGRLESGQSPEEIERDLPDLGGGAEGMDGGGLPSGGFDSPDD